MSWSRSQLVEIKRRLRVINCPVVLYGDTDSIVLFKEDSNNLFTMYPEMLQTALSNNVTANVHGGIDAVGDITVVAKKLYFLTLEKFSAKGHNRNQLTRQHFLDALNGKRVVTTRESPYKEIYLEGRTLYSHITPFVLQQRQMKPVCNELKHRNNYLYTGPVLQIHV